MGSKLTQLLLCDLSECRSTMIMNDDKSVVPECIRNNRFD